MKQNNITKYKLQDKSGDKINKLSEYLSVQQDILVAFVFGSFVSGDLTSMSDLDIALLFEGNIEFTRLQRIREELADLLVIEDVDIVVLNTASPVIKMQILKKRQAVTCEKTERV